MTTELEGIKVYYNYQMGQLIATLGDIAIGVFQRTDTPHLLGCELMSNHLQHAGNLAACTPVYPVDEPEEPVTENPVEEPDLPLDAGGDESGVPTT